MSENGQTHFKSLAANEHVLKGWIHRRRIICLSRLGDGSLFLKKHVITYTNGVLSKGCIDFLENSYGKTTLEVLLFIFRESLVLTELPNI